jgi:hypothetical protein
MGATITMATIAIVITPPTTAISFILEAIGSTFALKRIAS